MNSPDALASGISRETSGAGRKKTLRALTGSGMSKRLTYFKAIRVIASGLVAARYACHADVAASTKSRQVSYGLSCENVKPSRRDCQTRRRSSDLNSGDNHVRLRRSSSVA